MMVVNCLVFVLLFQASQGIAARDAVTKANNESLIVKDCPTWHSFNSQTNECTCQSLKEFVKCDDITSTGMVSIMYGYCMTYDSDTSETQVGKCFYTLFSRPNESLYTVLPPNPHALNEFMCGQLHREGYLCSKCEANYGLSVANFYMKCIECTMRKGVGWFLYFILQLLPVTLLFVIVIMFRLSLTQPPMNGFLLYSHLCLGQMYLFAPKFQTPYLSTSASQTFIALRKIYLPMLGLWNLGFFGVIEDLTSFCVDSRLNHLDFFFLTYITSIHVLLLVVTTFICIELHARNCRVIVCLWKPFFKYFVRFTRVWDSKRTAIDTFATFLLMSYSRIIILSYFIYSFQRVYTLSENLDSRIVLLYNPSVSFFDRSFLPYALLNLVLLIVLIFTPAITLALYQMKTFQCCLGYLRLHRCLPLRIFIELFQGCYKDGTNGTYDLRFTSSLYLFIRLSALFSIILCGFSDFASCQSISVLVLVLAALLFIAIAQPYKDNRMNKVDLTLLAMLVVLLALLSLISEHQDTSVNAVVLSCVLVLVALPQVVFYVYLIYKLTHSVSKLRCCQKVLRKFPHRLHANSRDELTLSQIDSEVFQELSSGRFNSSYEESSSFTESHSTSGRTY